MPNIFQQQPLMKNYFDTKSVGGVERSDSSKRLK